MPFTENMVYRAIKNTARFLLGPPAEPTQANTPKSASAFSQRCFVVGKEGALQDIEMLKCENCEMWYQMGRICDCKRLPESNLVKMEEEAYEAILDVPVQDYPFTCQNCGFQVLGPEHKCRIETRHKRGIQAEV